MVVLADRICQRSSIHQALMPTANPHRHEEKVAHNSPLLRRVSDPFSKRPVVDNFKRRSRNIAAVRTRIHPQIWRKRQFYYTFLEFSGSLDTSGSPHQLAHGRRMAHPQSAGQPIVLHRCAALHHGSAHYLARVTLSQQLKFCRTSWQFHFCANDAEDAFRLVLMMGTHRRAGETPSALIFAPALSISLRSLSLKSSFPRYQPPRIASIACALIFPPSFSARASRQEIRRGCGSRYPRLRSRRRAHWSGS